MDKFRKNCIAFSEYSPHFNKCEAMSNSYFCTEDCPFFKEGTDEERDKRDREMEEYKLEHTGVKG